MTHPLITMSDQYETVNGNTVRVLCVDLKHDGLPVIAVSTDKEGNNSVLHLMSDGKLCFDDDKPFIRKVRKKVSMTLWVNFYPNGYIGTMYPEKKYADDCADKSRIACKQITIEAYEGEGLEK